MPPEDIITEELDQGLADEDHGVDITATDELDQGLGDAIVNTTNELDQRYEIISARFRKPGEIMSSTERRLRPTSKRWESFCSTAGIDAHKRPRSLDEFLKPDIMAKMRSFVTWLNSQDLSIGQMEAGIFLQNQLNPDCNVHDQPTEI
jgi:hypothetical protein